MGTRTTQRAALLVDNSLSPGDRRRNRLFLRVREACQTRDDSGAPLDPALVADVGHDDRRKSSLGAVVDLLSVAVKEPDTPTAQTQRLQRRRGRLDRPPRCEVRLMLAFVIGLNGDGLGPVATASRRRSSETS